MKTNTNNDNQKATAEKRIPVREFWTMIGIPEKEVDELLNRIFGPSSFEEMVKEAAEEYRRNNNKK